MLDLDETLAHYVEHEPGVGYLAPRPGAQDFLQRMNGYGFELVIFTAATQDYADWVRATSNATSARLKLFNSSVLDAIPFFAR